MKAKLKDIKVGTCVRWKKMFFMRIPNAFQTDRHGRHLRNFVCLSGVMSGQLYTFAGDQVEMEIARLGWRFRLIYFLLSGK